jgi:hypothetical protein
MKMLEVAVSTDDLLMESWATAISLIHDNYISLFRNVTFGSNYGQFSIEAKIYESIAKPSLYVIREI